MAVHAQSVIPTWINTWDSALYTKLTDQENWCYTGPTDTPVRTNDTFTNWSPIFTNLVTALTNWKNVNRQSLISDFIPIAYSYNVLNFLYSTGSSANTTASKDSVFAMNGFPTTSKARATNYYNDLVIGTPNSSAKITADISTINAAAALESGVISSAKSTMQSLVSSHMSKSLFQDVPMTGNFPGKSGMASKIFIDMGYKTVYQVLNVGTLTLPPGV